MTLIDCTFFVILGILAGGIALALAKCIVCIIRGRNQ